MPWLDQLKYGNPTFAMQKICAVETPYDFILDSKLPPPKNSDDIVCQEIKELVILAQTQLQDAVISRYLWYDQTPVAAIMAKFCVKIFPEHEKQLLELGHRVTEQLKGIIFKTKFKWQRPRPMQTAIYLNEPLHPGSAMFPASPSYPSGKVLLADVIGHVIALKMQDTWEKMENKPEGISTPGESIYSVVRDIAFSRQYLGLNYKSDIEYSYVLSSLLTDSNIFITNNEL